MPARQRFRDLLRHVWHNSPFYRDLYQSHGLRERDIPDLEVHDVPLLTKPTLMANFDAAVTDSRLCKRDLERWLEDSRNPLDMYDDDFIVIRSSGGTATIGIFVYATAAWQIMATSVAPRLPRPGIPSTGRLRSAFYVMKHGHFAGVTTAARASVSTHDTLTVSLLDPEEEVITRLNAFQPQRLTSYASGASLLADWALDGKLSVAPLQIVVSGDRLTVPMEAKIRAAFDAPIYNLYAAAESLFIATKATGQEAWRVVDRLNILEVLDERGRPVRPGERGRAVLTNLFNYTLPILRYELGDHVVHGPSDGDTTTLLDVIGKTHEALPVTLDNGEPSAIPLYDLTAFHVPSLTDVQFVSERQDHVRIDYRATHDIDESLRRAFDDLLVRHGARRTAFTVRRVAQIRSDARTAKLNLVRRADEGTLEPVRLEGHGAQQAPSDRGAHPPTAHVRFPRDDLEGSIVGRFERQAARVPRRPAVEDGPRVLTYEALNRASNRVARAVLAHTPPGPEPVVLLCGHGAAMAVAVLGVLKAGKPYVPLDPAYPRARVVSMAVDAQARLILTDDAHAAVATASATHGQHVVNLDALDLTLDDTNPGLTLAPDTLACLLYTSGSTGQPKGVVLDHRNVLHQVMTYTNDFRIHEDDRVALLQSYIFSASLRDIFGSLLVGATLLPFDLKQRGMRTLAGWLFDERITICYAVPTVFRQFLATLSDEAFPTLRMVRLGGEPVSRRDVEGYKRHFAPPCILVNGLAATETGTIRQYVIDHDTPIAGQPCSGRLSGDRQGDPAGRRDRPGGRHRRRRRDRREESLSGEGVLAAARRPVLGRSPPARTPGPRGSSVLAIWDVSCRTGGSSMLAARTAASRSEDGVSIRPRSRRPCWTRGGRGSRGGGAGGCGRQPGVGRIRGASRATRAHCVRTGTGSPPDAARFHDPRDVRPAGETPDDAYWQGRPRRAARPSPREAPAGVPFTAPRNATEQVVVAIWSEVLQFPDIGVQDNLFDLGGHSLTASLILSRVQETFGVDVPLPVLFDTPTVAGLAAFLDQGGLPRAVREGSRRHPP